MRRIAMLAWCGAGCGPSLVDVGDSTSSSTGSGNQSSTATMTAAEGGEADGNPGDAVTSVTTAPTSVTGADTTGQPDTGITTNHSESSDGTTGRPEPIALDDCPDPPQFVLNELMAPDSSLFGAVVFDANGTDGLDLAITDTSGRVFVWTSTSGGFAAPIVLTLEAGAQPHDIVAGDVNEDGTADLIVADHVGDRVWTWLADGLGGYLAPVAMDVILPPWTMSLQDIDADGHLDLAVLIDRDHGYLLALYGDGSGAFVPGAEFAVPSGPTEFAIADLDLDGWMDAFGTSVGTTVLVRENVGDGFFDNAESLDFPGEARGALAADLDADGFAELVVSASDVDDAHLHVWSGVPDFSYGAPTLVIPPLVLRHVVAVDVGGGPTLDVASVGDTNEGAALWLMRDWGTSAVCQSSTPIGPGAAHRFAAGDLDADGDQDFVIPIGSSPYLLMRE